MFRIFQVTLADSDDRRVGLQMGFNTSNSQQSIAGVVIQPDSQLLHRDGGYAATDGNTPANWSYDQYYRVTIDINGTGAELPFHGNPLASGKVRVTYNTEDSSVSTYTMVFDLPTEFADISAIAMMRPAHVTSFAVDNFRFEAIPEPGTAFLFLLGGAAMMRWKLAPRS